MMNRWEEENLIARIKQIREDMKKEETIYDQAKSWPFQEARRLLSHIERKGKKPGDLVTFETGYGPSGAPHIGTFGEVVRTLWVMRAFKSLTHDAYPVRLIMFSDDYDALRKVPDGMPEWMNDYLGYRLTAVPNPYDDQSLHASPGKSFGMANNLKLTQFVSDILDAWDPRARVQFIETPEATFDRAGIFFCSSTHFYRRGRFNDQLKNVWDNHAAILDILLPTFRSERASTYSAFMPLSGPDGQLDRFVKGAVEIAEGWDYHVVSREKGFPSYSPVTDGMAKCQWYVDWAMRWTAFDVDYEMSGKDLIDSVKLSSQICKVLGGTPPLNLTYELFVDEEGAKISKSKGNGFTMDQWLTYGNLGSLMLFMFQAPQRQKKLYRDLVPQMTDQFLKLRLKEATPDDANWHFTVDTMPILNSELSYQLLLNLAIVSQARTTDDLKAYLTQTRELTADDEQLVNTLAPKVIRYAQDKGLFDRELREPTDQERAAFRELAMRFSMMLSNMDAEAFQYQVYEVGKKHGFSNLRDWFKALYECLLGSSDGPRFGAFTVAYGLENTIRLLNSYEEPVAA